MTDTTLNKSEHNLVWIDLEMSGLLPETDRILELAVVVTDAQLTQRVEGPVLAIHQSDAVLDGMDAWNKGTHGRSGLIERVRASPVDEAAAQSAAIAFLQAYVPAGKSPMCGNSICQDRRFLARGMPTLEATEASNQLVLESTQLGYKVGVRVNLDVLNAQTQLFQSRRELAKARYDVLLGGLRLRQASGQLQGSDIDAVNALLAP